MKIKLKELDHLFAQQRRGILNDPILQKKLKRLLSGKEGESKVVALLKKYLPAHFKILRNVWLEVDGDLTEVDILVVSANFWWAIEVKNYEGNFEYRDSCCFINQRQIPDQIAAFRNRMRIVHRLADKIPKGKPVIMASMVFINELCRVNAEPQPDFALLMSHQFIWQIQEMVKLDQQARVQGNIEDSLQLINTFTSSSPYLPSVLPVESLLDLKTGVYCPSCFSYQVGVTKQSFTCLKCAHKFFKHEGIVRTACELGVLYFNEPKIITTQNVWRLCDQTISRKRISGVLSQKMTLHGKARNTYFHNSGVPYENWIRKESIR